MEHVFYLLSNGFLDEAYQKLVQTESWRYGEQTIAQEKELKLLQGYRALLDYQKWLKKKTELLELGEYVFLCPLAPVQATITLHNIHGIWKVGLNTKGEAWSYNAILTMVTYT